MYKKKIILFLIILISCKNKEDIKEKETLKEEIKQKTRVINVLVDKPKIDNFIEYIELNGDVVPSYTVNIFSELSGKIINIKVGIGSWVNKGQAIAYIDRSRPGAEFKPSAIIAPSAGYVTSFLPKNGEMISNAQSLGIIGNLSSLRIEIYVPEKYIAKIKKGLGAEVNFESFKDEKFSAKVLKYDILLDPVSRSLKTTLSLNNKNNLAKSGMFAKVKLILSNREDILQIPSKALIMKDNNYYIYMFDNNKAHLKEIKIGFESDDYTEIMEGVVQEDNIIINNLSFLSDGLEVKPSFLKSEEDNDS